MSDGFDAVVIGSGPNGLTAAARIARAGHRVLVLESANEIGGGTRSAALTLDGFVHDVCSSVHPFGAASPAFAALGLTDAGLVWKHPAVPIAHPLDGGRAVWLERARGAAVSDAVPSNALGDTLDMQLGVDARRWRRRVGPVERSFSDLIDEVFRPILHVPAHPISLARFGLAALRPATKYASGFDTDLGAALFAGLAAHSAVSLDAPQTAGLGLILGAAARTVGWPCAEGGSSSIAAALARIITDHGGEIATGHRVRAVADIPHARATLLDLSPKQFADIYRDELPSKYMRNLLRFRHGPGVVKIDYALSGPVPWTALECRAAGTVHVGGTMLEIAAAEASVAAGGLAERPFLICGQSTVADPSRAPNDHHTLWAYTHVPQGIDVESAADGIVASIEKQLERFAPGFRDVVMARHVMTPGMFEAHNPNLHGGDIAGGAMNGRQLLFRPMVKADPYRTPADHVYMCSASTPPGPGVHGMCGWNAAASALRHSLTYI